MIRLGMTDVLGEDGVEVIGAETRPQALLLLAGRLQPDAIVLDLGDAASRPLADRVRAAAPDATVVLWARDEDAVEILEPGDAVPIRIEEAATDALRQALIACHVNRVEE
jgi:DNA-binding NarL/FixJ family response regulator